MLIVLAGGLVPLDWLVVDELGHLGRKGTAQGSVDSAPYSGVRRL
jgi:hypothetical protein